MIYISHLYRFDEDLVAVGKTEKEAEEAIIKEYIRVFKIMNNGRHPSRERWDAEDTYLSLAKSEIYTVETDFGEVERI